MLLHRSTLYFTNGKQRYWWLCEQFKFKLALRWSGGQTKRHDLCFRNNAMLRLPADRRIKRSALQGSSLFDLEISTQHNSASVHGTPLLHSWGFRDSIAIWLKVHVETWLVEYSHSLAYHYVVTLFFSSIASSVIDRPTSNLLLEALWLQKSCSVASKSIPDMVNSRDKSFNLLKRGLHRFSNDREH